MASGGTTADVVIVGAGIMGLSTAYQLARRKAGRIVVLEKSGVAAGSSGSSSACLRLRYTHDEVIRLAYAGLQIYKHWPDFTGLETPRATFAHTGAVWMLREDRDVVEAERDRMAALGMQVQALGHEEFRERFPMLSLCGQPFEVGADVHECVDWESHLYEEESGYCTDPAGACQDLCEAAEREGVDVRVRTGVAAIRSSGGRVRGVDLDDGSRIDTPAVVNAAGPWCNRVNATAGVRLDWPLRPTRVQILLRVAAPDIAEGLPLVGDAAGGIYLRPDNRGRQILVGSVREADEREFVADLENFNQRIDPEMEQRLLYSLHHRIPALPYSGRVSGMAALYTVNDSDMHPVIGPTELEGFTVVNGFSGHGFKLGPAVGGMVARWLTGEAAELDPEVPIEFFSVDREPLKLREKNVLA